jgi:hypothetical protein
VLGGLLGVPVAAAINVVFRELYPTATTTAPATGAVPPAPASMHHSEDHY